MGEWRLALPGSHIEDSGRRSVELRNEVDCDYCMEAQVMNCPNCGHPDMEVSTTEPYKYTESGLSSITLVGIEVRTCPKCGERIASIPAIRKLHGLIAKLVVQKPTRLSGEEIRFLRTHLGRNKTDFAKLMGVSREQVSRWESDTSPIGAVADRALRLLVAYEAPNHDYDIDQLSKIGKKAERTPIRVEKRKAGWEFVPQAV